MADDEKAKSSQDEDKEPPKKKDRDSAAKAFYRAMYAGAEPDPDEFGINLGQEEEAKADLERENAASSAMAKRLQQELDAMEQRATEAENLYKRLAADFENYRKRVDRERQEFTATGIQKAIEAILPALDDMDLAKSKLSDSMDPKNMIDSLNMVYNRFARCLEQIGIAQLDVIGQPFDPRLHEPVQQIATREVPDGSIVHQLRPGYMFNDKVLRPSLVNVATSDGVEDEPEPQAEEASEEEESVEAAAADETAENSGDEGAGNGTEDDTSSDGDSGEGIPVSSTQDIPPVSIESKKLAKGDADED
ncbi:MAG: nucleotide exchange factor GrpE [Candidatus Melainabacteria bacterium]|nr:nucleotide exchange factor GrpE [Candidatus Melainabacteria bacterium]